MALHLVGSDDVVGIAGDAISHHEYRSEGYGIDQVRYDAWEWIRLSWRERRSFDDVIASWLNGDLVHVFVAEDCRRSFRWSTHSKTAADYEANHPPVEVHTHDGQVFVIEEYDRVIHHREKETSYRANHDWVEWRLADVQVAMFRFTEIELLRPAR